MEIWFVCKETAKNLNSIFWRTTRRKGNYCDNLATIGYSNFLLCLKIISRWNISKTVLPYFSGYLILDTFLETILPLSRWRHKLRSPQKSFFRLNYISLRCSLCTDQFLVKHYGSKIQGKWDITSYAKCYDVITGRKGNFFFLNIVILYIIWKVFYCWRFLKDQDLRITQKTNSWRFL